MTRYFTWCSMSLGGVVGRPTKLELWFDNRFQAGPPDLVVEGEDRYRLWNDLRGNLPLLAEYGWRLDPTLYAP